MGIVNNPCLPCVPYVPVYLLTSITYRKNKKLLAFYPQSASIIVVGGKNLTQVEYSLTR